jgi:NAD(P)H-dependent FMN reductase
MVRLAVVTGSVRPGRKGAAVASWVVEVGQQIDAPIELVDLADIGLPLLDEPVPAALSADYMHSHTRRWSELVAGYDGFVFVTPEYNHSMPGVLKNALDFLYHEWNTKAAGIVSYGIDNGVRAAEHLRQVCAELQMATVRSQVSLSLFEDFDDLRQFVPRAHHHATLLRLLDELIGWASALRHLRMLTRPPTTGDPRVVVVGRAPWKMREALRVLRAAGFDGVGVFDAESAAAAIEEPEPLLAVVLGGSVGPDDERKLRRMAESRRAAVLRTAIGHDDPARHFSENVLPRLETLRRSFESVGA